MVLTKQEINDLIDAKIRAHEIRVGLISAAAGVLLLPLLLYVIIVFLLRVML